MQNVKRLLTSTNDNKLQRYVRRWLNEQASDYDSGVNGVLQDLAHGGCASGFVGELIATYDCLQFYKKYRKEIAKLLASTCQDSGLSVNELFGEKWDSEDPLAMDSANQNLLAWFGFEETAHRMAYENGIEL